jgi:hypothetical protein
MSGLDFRLPACSFDNDRYRMGKYSAKASEK